MNRRQSVKSRKLSKVSLAAIVCGLASSAPLFSAFAQSTHEHHSEEASEPAQGGQAASTATQGGAASTATVQDVVVNLGHSHGGHGAGEKLKEEVLTKTPQSGNVITSTTITDQQIDNLNDVAQYVAGYRPNITSARASRMAIRGVGISQGSGGSGAFSDTGYVVDDVYWQNPAFTWGDLIDVSSVELLYGPTGTAGNKNTDVGSLIFHTQLPSFDDKTTIAVNYGTYNRTRDTINTTGTLIPDTLAYRFSGYVNHGDGPYRDGYSGSTYLDTNRAGLHFQLLGVGDNWSDRLSFTYNGSNEHNDYLTGTVGDTSLVYANRTIPKTTFFQNMLTKLHWPVLTVDPNTPYIARDGRDPTHVLMLTNTFNRQIGENTFKSISAFGYAASRLDGFSDNQLLELGFGSGGMDSYILQGSQEFRLSSPKDQPFEWTTGLFTFAEYTHDDMHHWEFGYNSAQWLGYPGAIPGLTPWWIPKSSDFQAAPYGQATWHVNEQAAITFGLRDSYEIRYRATDYEGGFIYGLPITPAQQAFATAAAGGYFTSSSGGFTSYHNGVIGIVNPQYKFNDNILLYALVGRGDKAGAVNTSAGDSASWSAAAKTFTLASFAPPFTKSTISWDYEVGAKTNWLDGKLISNVNLYWNDLYNFQLAASRVIATSPVTLTQTFLGTAPLVRLRGVEFVQQWSPIEQLTLNLTGAYTEARYISYPDAPAPADYAFAGGPPQLSLSNTRVPGLPWWQINGGYAYHLPVGRIFASLGGWLGEQSYTVFHYTNAAWFDKAQYTSPLSFVQYWQPAYVLFDAGFGFHTDDRRFQVTLWGKNLFNNRPFTSWSPGSSSAPTTVGISTQGPRLLGVTSSYTF
jgi:iron complex outermembrane receptor protein